jgi:Mitochondrial carrier protein
MDSLSTLGGFTAGALAACGAVTVTNPMEVVKTRLQLQGELAAKGQVKKIYTGVFQALRIIAINEGIKGSPRFVVRVELRNTKRIGRGGIVFFCYIFLMVYSIVIKYV